MLQSQRTVKDRERVCAKGGRKIPSVPSKRNRKTNWLDNWLKYNTKENVRTGDARGHRKRSTWHPKEEEGRVGFSHKVILACRFDPQICEEALWRGFYSFMYLFILSSNIYFSLRICQAVWWDLKVQGWTKMGTVSYD